MRTIDQNQIPQVQVLTPGVQLSGKVRKVQELEHAETTLCLQQFGLAKETVRTLAWIKGGRKPGYRRAPDTLSLPGVQHIDIQVYSRLHVVYPKQSSEHQFVKEMLYCKDEYPMGKDKYWLVPRYDTVLVQYGKGRDDGGTMDRRRIARLRCLFRTPILGGQQLAFVQWFKTNRDPEESTGMFATKKTDEYEVIELATIERGVHLIPLFGGMMENPPRARAEVGKPFGLDAFDTFVVNNHIDIELYNTIYG